MVVSASGGSDVLPTAVAQYRIRQVVEGNPNTIRANIQRRMTKMTLATSTALQNIYNAKNLTQKEKDDATERKKRELATYAEYDDNADFRQKVQDAYEGNIP